MRTRLIVFVAVAALGLAGCGRKDSGRADSAARQAGRAAYHFTQDTKKAAKELGKDVRRAGQQARQGWNEAKRKDRARPEKK